VQPHLVRQLGGVAPHEVEVVDGGEAQVGAAVLVTQDLRQPATVDQQVLEDEGEPLGDGVVAEVAVLEGELRPDVGEVLRVPGLVEEHAVIVLAPVRQHDEVDLVGHTYRRTERAR